MTADTTYALPADRAYDAAQHTWALYDPAAATALIGIDALGQASMGDLAFLVLPAVGDTIRRNVGAGSLEAAKMTGDVLSPLSGKVLAVNAAALRDPSLVNRDPYGDGWLLKIRPADWAGESAELIAGEAVSDWAEAEITRYRTEGWI
ncbi:glycine cleavage system protein H [Chloroflexales bacterium ZM16-3]|nr:glycine cleavage system protein H [Chloroflexales bacterium ZM16-3]